MLKDNFCSQEGEFLGFLKLLSDNALLDKVVVAGSWAEYVYSQSGLLEGFDGTLKTLDVDFLVKNMRLPNPPANILNLAAAAGCDIMHDFLYDTTKIITPNKLEIEFLINQLGSGEKRVLPTNLGVNAQALRHMDISLRNTVVVDLAGLSVSVPSPEAYVLHKMVINSTRRPDKQAKDVKSIYQLAPHLDEGVYAGIYKSLTKKEQKEVNLFLEKHGALFKDVESLDDVLADAHLASLKHRHDSRVNVERDLFNK